MEATEPKKWSLMEFLTLWQCLSLSLSAHIPTEPIWSLPKSEFTSRAHYYKTQESISYVLYTTITAGGYEGRRTHCVVQRE